MRDKYLCDKNMFNVPAQGIYCGLLMPTKVMRKVMKVQSEATRAIRKILYDYIDEIYPTDWTLANNVDEDGKILKQVTIYYTTDDTDAVERRIGLFKPRQPQKVDVYIVPTREVAELIAEEVLKEEMEGSQC